MEPPSKPLVDRLLALRLCSQGDLRGCRALVKRMAQDLPTFDFVWLDALVQRRKLTPFQAQVLSSSQPDRLAIGPCVLIRKLAGDRRVSQFEARRREAQGQGSRKERLNVTFIPATPEALGSALERLEKFIQRVSLLDSPALALPQVGDHSDGQLVVISPHVDGPSLDELLVRRGRFPIEAVLAIAKQLAATGALLESAGVVHGEIRLKNVRLSPRGESVLTLAGVFPALEPEFTIHSDHPPDCYDGIAPERITEGSTATPLSEVYAWGCLLWQLLAGRPPFTTNDPLGKLAAHQTKSVPNVRELRPDTPPELAEWIRRATLRDPLQRPTCFREISQTWGRPGSWSRRRLMRFLATFDSAEPRARPVKAVTFPAKSVVTATLCLALASCWLWGAGGKTTILQMVGGRGMGDGGTGDRGQGMEDRGPGTGDLQNQAHATFVAKAVGGNGVNPRSPVPASRSPLPKRAQRGVIVLNQNGPYDATDLTEVGALCLKGAPGKRPVIIVTDRPLHLSAENVILENVTLRREPAVVTGSRFRTVSLSSSPAGSSSPPATHHAPLLQVDAQRLALIDCQFENSSPELENAHFVSPTLPQSIQWRLLETAERSTKKLVLQQVTLLGAAGGILLPTGVQELDVTASLKTGAGPLFELSAAPAPGQQLLCRLNNSTLRNTGPLLRWSYPGSRGSMGQILIETAASVWDISPQSSLIEVLAERPPTHLEGSLKIVCRETFLSSNTPTTSWHKLKSPQKESTPLDDAQLIDGVQTATFTFAGSDLTHPAESQLLKHTGLIRKPKGPQPGYQGSGLSGQNPLQRPE